jgi:hypothetical protein
MVKVSEPEVASAEVVAVKIAEVERPLAISEYRPKSVVEAARFA